MSDYRIWHACHDPYHTAFRFVRIMSAVGETRKIEYERLCILDFFLVFPFLLHKVHIPMAMTSNFKEANVVKPEDHFLQLPSAVSLFRDMSEIQNNAAKSLTAQGVFDRQAFIDEQKIEFHVDKVPNDLLATAVSLNDRDEALIEFLINIYGQREIGDLKESTGLKRRLI